MLSEVISGECPFFSPPPLASPSFRSPLPSDWMDHRSPAPPSRSCSSSPPPDMHSTRYSAQPLHYYIPRPHGDRRRGDIGHPTRSGRRRNRGQSSPLRRPPGPFFFSPHPASEHYLLLPHYHHHHHHHHHPNPGPASPSLPRPRPRPVPLPVPRRPRPPRPRTRDPPWPGPPSGLPRLPVARARRGFTRVTLTPRVGRPRGGRDRRTDRHGPLAPRPAASPRLAPPTRVRDRSDT